MMAVSTPARSKLEGYDDHRIRQRSNAKIQHLLWMGSQLELCGFRFVATLLAALLPESPVQCRIVARAAGRAVSDDRHSNCWILLRA